jgi:hypothetical protein
MPAATSTFEGFTRANVVFTGESGLVLDNIEAMIDPLRKDKDALVKKKGLTEAEQEQVFALEWRMGLYTDGAGIPIVPAKCVMAAMTQAARALRLGKAIERGAVQLVQAELPIMYDGPRTIKGLWEDSRFQFKTIVNLTPTTATRSMGVRVRPIFRDWALRSEMVVMLDAINWDDFVTIMEITGRQGLCNARRIGYGRFTPEISKITS